MCAKVQFQLNGMNFQGKFYKNTLLLPNNIANLQFEE